MLVPSVAIPEYNVRNLNRFIYAFYNHSNEVQLRSTKEVQ